MIGLSIRVSPAVAAEPSAMWSSKARSLWQEGAKVHPSEGLHIAFTSRNGHFTVRVDDDEMTVSDNLEPPLVLSPTIPVGSIAEMVWAPTSDAFVVTETDGGWVETWSVTAFRVGRENITSSRPVTAALADFKTRYPNCPEEYPNVAAVGWGKDTSQLMLVVEMPCHSSCVDMCKVLGYVVDPVTGVIARSLTSSQLRKSWADSIGPRLQKTP